MTIKTGIDNTWEIFSSLSHTSLIKRGGATFDKTQGVYQLLSFGQVFSISKEEQTITCDSEAGKQLLNMRNSFFDLSMLWYLIRTEKLPLSGKLIKPTGVPGGQIFVKGTHVLPLHDIAHEFNNNPEAFFQKGAYWGGKPCELGNVAVEFFPFPRVPMIIMIWFGDNELPPSSQLLLDASCATQLSTDVLWATAMVCCNAILS